MLVATVLSLAQQHLVVEAQNVVLCLQLPLKCPLPCLQGERWPVGAPISQAPRRRRSTPADEQASGRTRRIGRHPGRGCVTLSPSVQPSTLTQQPRALPRQREGWHGCAVLQGAPDNERGCGRDGGSGNFRGRRAAQVRIIQAQEQESRLAVHVRALEG